jgi:hypothetical protein
VSPTPGSSTTPTATETGTPTATPTDTPVETVTATPTDTATGTPSATVTPGPGATATSTTTATATLPGPTATATPPVGVCAPQPLASCRRALRPDGGTLTLTDRTPDTNDGVSWRWGRGPVVPKTAFGDPLASTAYRFCIYDAGSIPLLGVTIPAGGICNAKTKRPCWKAVRHGFSYRNTDRARSAIQSIDLREGLVDNVARIALRGRGPLLGMPSLPALVLPLTVQLQATSGECWESFYSAPVSRRSGKSFVDKAD